MKEAPSFRLFLPLTLVALSLLVYFATTVSTALRESATLAAVYEANEKQLANKNVITKRLENVAGGLYRLSKTNETAAVLTKKHKIQYQESPAAP